MRAPIALLLAIALSLLLIAPTVRGQTTTPNPTPTPMPTPYSTPIPGSAEDVFLHAYLAMQAVSTYHYTAKTTASIPYKLKETNERQADVDQTAHAVHILATDQLTNRAKKQKKPTSTTVEAIVVNSSAAMRTGKNGPWQCVDPAVAKALGMILGTVPVDTGSDGTVTPNPSSDAQIKLEFASPETDTINGIPVWHVLLSLPEDISVPAAALPTVDVYISQSDYRLVREKTIIRMKLPIKVHGKKKTVTMSEKSTTDYSAYGEPASITLPSVCPAQTAAVRLWTELRDPAFGPMGRSLNSFVRLRLRY